MDNQAFSVNPLIVVHSNHPFVLQMVMKMLASGPYRISSFSPAKTPQHVEACSWILVLDTCSIEDWLEMAIQCHRQGGRSIILLPESLLSDEEELRLIVLGVSGIVPVLNLEDELRQAVDSVTKGQLWLRSSVISEYVRRTNQSAAPVTFWLTAREEQILGSLIRGLSNKEIGNMLGISDRTAKFHVSNILRKFNVRNRRDLLRKRQAHASRQIPSSPAGGQQHYFR